MTRDELIALMRARSFIIYGNGYVAHRFYNCIKRLGTDAHLIGFVITHVKDGDIGADGKPVMAITDVKNMGGLLFIAAHDAVVEEMRKTAKDCGFQNIIWIYPLLWELELGEPIERGCLLDTRRLVAEQSFYNLAVYYLTIEQILHGKESTLYVQMQSAWSTTAVAEKRFKKFKSDILVAEKDGYHVSAPVKVSERYELFDGIHRTALAVYFHLDKITADIYQGCQKVYDHSGIYRRGILLEEDLYRWCKGDDIILVKQIYENLKNGVL